MPSEEKKIDRPTIHVAVLTFKVTQDWWFLADRIGPTISNGRAIGTVVVRLSVRL